jgi:hypothetical protein
MGLFQLCHRKYDYSYNQRLVPTGPRIALEFGRIYQKGLTVLYETRDIELALAGALSLWEPFEGLDTTKLVRNKKKMEELLRAYEKEFFGKEQWTDNGGEILLSYPLCEGVDFVGKQDRRGYFGDTRAIQENKTSTFPGMFVDEPNNQICGYLWLESKILGEKVRKVIVTIAWLHKNSVKGLIYPKVKADPPKSVFIRDPITVEDFLIEEFEKDVIQVAQDIMHYQDIEYWPKNAPQACGTFGGCEYKSLCLCSDEEKKVMAEMQFNKKELKPE